MEAISKTTEESLSLDHLMGKLNLLLEEVQILSSHPAALGTVQKPSPSRVAQAEECSVGQIDHAIIVRREINLRRKREDVFGKQYFADPAWDILLDLYGAQLAQYRVPVSALCAAAAVPTTTALRWIKNLEDGGLLERSADPLDGRRIYVALTQQTAQMMREYFDRFSHSMTS